MPKRHTGCTSSDGLPFLKERENLAMNLKLRKLFLSELNMAVFQQGDIKKLTDKKMAMAMTVNENLKSLGFTLKSDDIVKLAVSPSLINFFDSIKKLVPVVRAEPMYPDFPKQVMEISEAQFRFHQSIHYFSTYGVERLLGGEVQKGWLPDMASTPKTEEDKVLLNAKVLALEEEEKAYEIALSIILGKRERMTIPEQRIVVESVSYVSGDFLKELSIPFKENLEILFHHVFYYKDREECISILSSICQHTGDVLKLIYGLMKEENYHFRTSQKKTLVRLLEKFPVADFRGNLILSRKNRERNLLILQHLDYNIYSRSIPHKKAVADLRDGKLQSWEGYAKKMLLEKADGALDFVAKRPGIMVRMINWLLNLGYTKEEISERLCANAASLNTQTLVKMLRLFRDSRVEDYISKRENELDSLSSSFKGRRYWLSFEYLNREKNGNIEGCEWELRDFVNWEVRALRNERDREVRKWQKKKIDQAKDLEIKKVQESLENEMDFYTMNQKKEIRHLEKMREKLIQEIEKIRKKEKSNRAISSFYHGYLSSCNGVSAHTFSWEKMGRIEKLRLELTEIKTEISSLKDEIQKIRKDVIERHPEICEKIFSIEQKYRQMEEEACLQLAEIYKNFEEKYEEIYHSYRKYKAAEILQIQKDYERKLEMREDLLLALEQEEKEMTEQVIKKYDQKIRVLHNTPAKREILKEALKSHFHYITTKLWGRKIYFDMDDFNLAYSTIETNDKSKDGGYIRSGIAYRLPEDAERIRFFVYWNDDDRVDVDLHTGGFDLDGEEIEIGWNSEFRNKGVVFSGDITHSNAVEYIDIDMSAPIREIYANIDLYFGKRSFEDIRECYVGILAVKDIEKHTKPYHPANCFFTHEIRQPGQSFYYGYIDVQNRYVKFVGDPNTESWTSGNLKDNPEDMFSLEEYMTFLLEGQKATRVDKIEEADIVLTIGKSERENGISLIDENFFMDVV